MYRLPTYVSRGASVAFALTVTALWSCDSNSSIQGFTNLSVPPAVDSYAAGEFVPESNQGGLARSVRVLGVYVGRLVDVYDLDAASGLRTLQHRDFAIGLDIASNGTDYELRWSQAGQRDVLTVLHPAGSAGYAAALEGLDADLTPLLDRGLDASTAPPFTDVPRNAA